MFFKLLPQNTYDLLLVLTLIPCPLCAAGRRRQWFSVVEAKDLLSHKPVQVSYLDGIAVAVNGVVERWDHRGNRPFTSWGVTDMFQVLLTGVTLIDNLLQTDSVNIKCIFNWSIKIVNKILIFKWKWKYIFQYCNRKLVIRKIWNLNENKNTSFKIVIKILWLEKCLISIEKKNISSFSSWCIGSYLCIETVFVGVLFLLLRIKYRKVLLTLVKLLISMVIEAGLC